MTDDPEGQQVLHEVERAWRNLPSGQRNRVHLASLPMADIGQRMGRSLTAVAGLLKRGSRRLRTLLWEQE